MQPQHFIITPEKGGLGSLRYIPIPTHSREFIPYMWETIGSGNDILYSNIAPPSPLFHKEKRTVVKSFKLTRKFQQISGFLLKTSEKNFFFPNYFFFFWGGGNCPPAPPLATALQLLNEAE